ncbi:MAG: response regulator transcription factor [Elusimicrobiota bacterium]|nr:MAG: response regulator transcription factor [Elusimicrobiota bacterium]
MSKAAKPSLLVVEDEKDLAYVLASLFKKEGYTVHVARDGKAGLKLARAHKPDLVVTDVMLPLMDGHEMIRQLRVESKVPVLFLTAKRDEADRVRGFQLGADDYITKPFSMRELVARVRAVLRRAGRAGEAQYSVRAGGLEIDFARHEVRVNGKPKHLAPREFQLLKLLIEANGHVLSREELLKTIWGYDESLGISTRTVDQHVARLRRSLASERKRIVTVKNFGYRIKAP